MNTKEYWELFPAPPTLDTRTTCQIILAKGGAPIPESELLWPESLPHDIASTHYFEATTPDMAIKFVPGAIIYGMGWIRHRGQPFFDRSIFPEYCKTYFENGWVPGRELVPAGLTGHQLARAWSVTHFNCATYGHWLLEGIPKLLAIQEFKRRWPEFSNIPIIIPNQLPRFIVDTIATFLPGSKIILFHPAKEFIHVQQLMLPTWGLDHTYHPFLAQLLDQTPAASPAQSIQKIYVSRRIPSHYRVMTNAMEIEEIASRNGFSIIYPEELPLTKQIGIFRNARIIVGEYGSGLHNAIFSGPDTQVLALNWINDCQSRIARFRSHRLGFLLPRDGSPVLYERGAGMKPYEIDPVVFDQYLKALPNHSPRVPAKQPSRY